MIPGPEDKVGVGEHLLRGLSGAAGEAMALMLTMMMMVVVMVVVEERERMMVQYSCLLDAVYRYCMMPRMDRLIDCAGQTCI